MKVEQPIAKVKGYFCMPCTKSTLNYLLIDPPMQKMLKFGQKWPKFCQKNPKFDPSLQNIGKIWPSYTKNVIFQIGPETQGGMH